MPLSLQTLAAWANLFAAQVQARTRAFVDFSVGSILGAVGDANASIALWFQWLLVLVLARTRFATSIGPDADSWAADFGGQPGATQYFARLGATFASGTVTLTRFTPTTRAIVLPGTQVRTGDGTQTFTVVVDTTNAAWNNGLGGFVVPIGTASVNLTVEALAPGTQGNVASGAISQVLSAISGIDTVTNASALQNGLDAESDARLRARFVLWINSRSLGVAAAVEAAVLAVQQNFVCTIQENVDTSGAFQAGHFVVTVDDGSGSPSDAEIAAAAVAVEVVRGLGITYDVRKPTLTTANVGMTIATDASVVHSAMAATVSIALTNFIAALPLGVPLPLSRLSQIAYDVSPAVTNVTAVTINSGTADIVPTAGGVVRPGTITVA